MPNPPRSSRRVEVISRHNEAMATIRGAPYVAHVKFNTSGHDVKTVRAPFTSLRRLDREADLQGDHVHDGCYIVGRTATDAFMMSGLVTVLELPDGCHFRLIVYDIPGIPRSAAAGNDAITVASRVVPRGALVAIKAPYYKTAMDGGMAIRVDNPANFFSNLRADDPALAGTPWATAFAAGAPASSSPSPSPSEPSDSAGWRKRGNDLLAKKDTDGALAAYARASSLDPRDPTPASNAAQALLAVGDWPAALEAADRALALDKALDKALLRRARALAELGRYREAADAAGPIAANPSRGPLAQEASTMAADWRTKQAQAETGAYEWSSLLQRAYSQREVRFSNEVADFTSPLIEVGVPVGGGKGLGVRALARVDPATLLVVARPAVLVFPSEVGAEAGERAGARAGAGAREEEEEVPSITVNLHRREVESYAPERQRAANLLSARLDTNRHLRSQLRTLSRGGGGSGGGGDDSDAADLAEAELVRRVLKTNAFGWLPLTVTMTNEEEVPEPPDSPAAGGKGSGGSRKKKEKGKEKDKEATPTAKGPPKGTGLWVAPSRFNHACEPNCTYIFVGDLLVVHAVRAVEKGEELTVSYVPPKAGARSDLSSWGFTCACSVCAEAGGGDLASLLPSGAPDWRLIHTRECPPEVASLRDAVATAPSADRLVPLASPLRALAERVRSDLRALSPRAVVRAQVAAEQVFGLAADAIAATGEVAEADRLLGEAAAAALASPVGGPYRAVLTRLRAALMQDGRGDKRATLLSVYEATRLFAAYWPGAAAGKESAFHKLFRPLGKG
jgi:tetratricopeptide (TPR) repeat protein